MGVFSGWFDPSSFAPHGFCLSWVPGLLELHAVSDAITGICYMAVGFLIFQFGRRRPDMGPAALFNALFVVFFLCGLTHMVDIVVLWRPVYVEQGLLKAVTAAASLPALIILIRLVPKAIGLPSSAQMAEVSREANFDPLTDLPNRRHLIHKLEGDVSPNPGIFRHAKFSPASDILGAFTPRRHLAEGCRVADFRRHFRKSLFGRSIVRRIMMNCTHLCRVRHGGQARQNSSLIRLGASLG